MLEQKNNPCSRKDAYDFIKKQLVACEYKPGERFNVDKLAEQFRLSVTPIREILYQLSAEKLVQVIPRTGFFVRQFAEGDIRDLYDFNCLLLLGAVGIANQRAEWNGASLGRTLSDVRYTLSAEARNKKHPEALATAELFEMVAAQSGNDEVETRVVNINDRLHFVRACEIEVMDDTKVILNDLCKHLEEGDSEGFGVSLKQYHEERIGMLPALMKSIKLCSTRVV